MDAVSLQDYVANKKKDGTKLLFDTDWYKNEKFFNQEGTELRWKLVSKELIPDSTGKNYLEQTAVLVNYVRGLYDDPNKIPLEVNTAITEWDDLQNDYSRFEMLQRNVVSSDEAEWKSAADTLEKLKFTQMFRESFIEWFYRTALTERTTGERLLLGKYSWTKSRTSGSDFVYAGYFDDGGGVVTGLRPRRSASRIGCAFSAAKL